MPALLGTSKTTIKRHFYKDEIMSSIPARICHSEKAEPVEVFFYFWIPLLVLGVPTIIVVISMLIYLIDKILLLS